MGQQIAQEYTSHGLAFDEKNDCVEVVLPDDIDTDAEKLADHARISLRGAEAALVWMRERYEQEIYHAAGDILARLITTIVPPKGRISLQCVALRFVGTAFLLNRSTESLTVLAGRCGVSKQLLDFHAIAVADKLKFHGFAQKRSEARAAYAAAQRESWSKLTPEERKARRAGKAAQSSSNDQI
jgi:hypothetical protein